MKVPHIKKLRQAGLTLIELSLVIAVLLGLISVLFVGVTAYKKGSDRAKCVLNISTVQKATRSFQNMYELEIGDALAVTAIAGAGKMIETQPTCPSAGEYTFDTVVPAAGTTYLVCSLGATESHVPSNTSGW